MGRPRKPMEEKCVKLWCSAPVGTIEELDCNIATIRKTLEYEYGFEDKDLENFITRSRMLREFVKFCSTPSGRDILLNSIKTAMGLQEYEQTEMDLD